MADTGFSTTAHNVTNYRPGGGRVKVTTGAKRYAIAVSSRTDDYLDCKPSTSAGERFILGVFDEWPDENGPGVYAADQIVSIADQGTIPVLLAPSESVDVDDTIIASGTPGLGKKLGAEAKPYDVLGYAAQKKTVGSGGPELCSVRLQIHRQEA